MSILDPDERNTPDPNAGPEDAEDFPPLETKERQRIDELRAHALAKPNPLAANLMCLTAGMMTMALQLEKRILAAAEVLPQGDSARRRVQPPIETYLRLMKQIGQFAHLDIKLHLLDRPREAAPAPALTLAELPLSQGEVLGQ